MVKDSLGRTAEYRGGAKLRPNFGLAQAKKPLVLFAEQSDYGREDVNRLDGVCAKIRCKFF